MTEPDLISRNAAAVRLGGVSTRTVDRMRECGQLETKHVRSRAMVTVESVERFLGRSSDPEPQVPDTGGGDWDGFEIPGLDDDTEEAA